jgi:hypothetical protein
MLLTPEAYGVREARLRAHAWSRRVMRSWLLVGDGSDVLASCETYRRKSLASGGEGSTWAVASVFTERALRCRGHASRMMSLLEEQVRQLDPSAHALVLYSDVGAPMYERAGYIAPGRAAERVWPAEPGEVATELLTDPVDLTPPEDPFVVWPDAAQLDWHRERERAYAALLGRQPFGSVGARAGDGVLLWTTGYRNDRLLVLAWNGRALEPLIETARRVAAASRLQKVVMWDQPGAQGGSLVPREGSLPMLHALDPRVRAEHWWTIPRAVWV